MSQSNTMRTFVLTGCVVMGLGACGERPDYPASARSCNDDKEVTVEFDSNGCITGATPDPLNICAGGKVTWRSSPATNEFGVYFRPIDRGLLGRPAEEKKKAAHKRRIWKKAPGVYYKYTVVGDNKAACTPNYHDPRIKVDY